LITYSKNNTPRDVPYNSIKNIIKMTKTTTRISIKSDRNIIFKYGNEDEYYITWIDLPVVIPIIFKYGYEHI